MDKRIKLGATAYHVLHYDGNQEFEIVGIRKNEVELKGDWSGGTHHTVASDWVPIEGLIFKDIIGTVSSIQIEDFADPIPDNHQLVSRTQFHKIWTAAVGLPGYDKDLFKQILKKFETEGIITSD